eukprot:1992083-Rhodomonas_salina.2
MVACICLRKGYAMSGTHIVSFGATSGITLLHDGHPTPVSRDSRDDLVKAAICLRTQYAMSGTDIAYGAIGLRARYAMPGTDLAYGATSLV